MEIKPSKIEVTKINVDFVDENIDKINDPSKTVYEILEAGEWKQINIKAIKKDQIFRINGSALCIACENSYNDQLQGWGVIYSPLDQLNWTHTFGLK